jgi:hypothetical protein
VSIGKRAGGILLVRPTGGFQLRACATNIEVGNTDKVHPLREPRLRHEHCAELAGAYQADGYGPPSGITLQQFAMKVHAETET